MTTQDAGDREDVTDIGGPRQPMIIASGLRKTFSIRGGGGWRKERVHAVDDVSFMVQKRETLGIVGESGSGKSTTARLLMHLASLDAGSILFDGQPVGAFRGLPVQELRRAMQMVFQDSYASLNPRLEIGETVAFGPRANGASRAESRERGREALQRVGLSPSAFERRLPHELSGGQRQRVNIARALALRPRVLILDEAVSALDKSVEAQVLNLLAELKTSLSLTYVFISHDLDVVRYMSERVMVMYLGKVVEIGTAGDLFDAPHHPYTRALLASRPTPGRLRRHSAPPLVGEPISLTALPSGCRFRTRCPLAEPVCASSEPALRDSGSGRFAACHFAGSPEALDAAGAQR